ncbi:sugar O-acetyltransferase [Phormidium tenue]|uniref:Acetyltransferase n=1 Tax=Phormidium tenue NIES-30 TaxID=549789 RepID=A0A1U7J4N4_9CYAN|nr:sugar O-acetyltransferase [Phormidium tenue]MBD2232827.1 sugar O-acetyltransferase [Phormidium tenue FACHB-1052]OKH47482.1 maltose acetyltransferase [Phormidium tenue NIES-30]
MAKTELEKMLANELYLGFDPELVARRRQTQEKLYEFNHARPGELEVRQEVVRSLFHTIGPNFEITPPFFCDYGGHIRAGKNLYLNTNCTILDCNWVTLGDDVLMAPNVQIYTAYHPVDPAVRLSGLEMAAPITIGSNVWLGGGVIVCPGVTIGDNTTVGAGSVVTKSIPANVVAVGNPCRILREV